MISGTINLASESFHQFSLQLTYCIMQFISVVEMMCLHVTGKLLNIPLMKKSRQLKKLSKEFLSEY